MKMEKYIRAPLDTETISSLKAGDFVYISGTIYTARDAAHKRMSEALAGKGALPIELKNNIIYYLGPSPAREGRVIGSAGPTTSGRMDKYTPALLDLGLKGMIGKGRRSKVVAYEDLGTEAVRKLEVENFPVIVVMDADGNDLYEKTAENRNDG